MFSLSSKLSKISVILLCISTFLLSEIVPKMMKQTTWKKPKRMTPKREKIINDFYTRIH